MDEFDKYLPLNNIPHNLSQFANEGNNIDDNPERAEIKIIIYLANHIELHKAMQDNMEAKIQELLQIEEQKERAYKK